MVPFYIDINMYKIEIIAIYRSAIKIVIEIYFQSPLDRNVKERKREKTDMNYIDWRQLNVK